MSNGQIQDITPNFQLIIPEFDIATWHDYLEENFRNIDSLFYNLFYIQNYKGIWKPLTHYNVGDVICIGKDYAVDENGNLIQNLVELSGNIIPEENENVFDSYDTVETESIENQRYEFESSDKSGKLYKVLVEHTTDSTPYFTQYFFNHTDYYEPYADLSATIYYSDLAKGYSEYAEQMKDNAQTSAENANTYKESAETFANNAQNSANLSLNYSNDALSYKNSAEQSKNEAQTAETNAKQSESLAESYKNAAQVAAENASTSETNAANSASAALGYKNVAQTYSENTESVYNDTLALKNTTEQYKNDAQSAASNAATSATLATSQAQLAQSSAESASSSASNANISAINAKTSEDNAKESETNANTSAENASTSATNAHTSEVNAKTSETNSAESEANALLYSQNAKISENIAKTSETNATTSATTATSQAQIATTKANEALTSAQNASNSANDASSYANNALTYRNQTQEIKDSLGTVYVFKGSVNTNADLPNNANIGDVYNVTNSGANYAWTGTVWDSLGADVDLSIYYTKTETERLLTPYRTSSAQDVIDNGKLDKVTASNKVYGTDVDGNQTTYDKNSFGQVDDVKVNGASVVTNKVADITVPGEVTEQTVTDWGFAKTSALTAKQDKLVIGTNIDITNNTISVKDVVNYNNITNCITEIPQDIKLELNNGTLTLKAGSKVYVPNGKDSDGNNIFDIITIQNDITDTPKENRQTLMCYNIVNKKLQVNWLTSCKSGDNPSGFSYGYYYNTTTNRLNDYRATIGVGASLPIAIVTDNGSIVTSIDQVFNGFGYIGSTVFALPGVKGLIPNGRNADGSLKNIERLIDRVYTTTTLDGNYNNNIYLRNDASGISLSRYWQYDEVVNSMRHNNEYNLGLLGIIGTCDTINGVISNFKPKTSFHTLDYNDFSNLNDKVVHKTGDEEINGEKTFNNTMYTTSGLIRRNFESGLYSTHRMVCNNNTAYSGLTSMSPQGKEAYFDVMAKADGTISCQASDDIIKTIVGWGMPKYTSGVQKANGGTYTESVDGVLIASSTATSGKGVFNVTINNITFNFHQEYKGTDYPHITNGFFPIPKNTSYKIDIDGNAKVVFYPLRRS